MKDITQDPVAMQALQTLKNLGFTEAEIRQAWDAVKVPLHLFREREGGDVYAARDLAHAKELYKADTSENPDEFTDWRAEPDDKTITVDCDGEKVTKTAAEWANSMKQAGHCFGENY